MMGKSVITTFKDIIAQAFWLYTIIHILKLAHQLASVA
jgi:hypothetical protein